MFTVGVMLAYCLVTRDKQPRFYECLSRFITKLSLETSIFIF